MNRPRRPVYTMEMYLKKIKDMDIRNDADTQRQFVWNNEQVNELIVTVLTEDYIPPIILAEMEDSQLWIVDGGQRSASFNKFRYGNYKITSAIENSIIPYKKKNRDENGKIIWEDAIFDIRNKTYDKLPEELQKKFNEYQIEMAIHENCDARRIAQLIKRYNNHTSMNVNQKAFTYIDNFAREVRDIIENRFFLDCGVYTEKEKNKGVLERLVLESVMCMFHFDNWKKQTKHLAGYLNVNSTQDEFEILNSNIKRLEKVITEDLRDLFSSKDSFIWFTLFNKFTELGFEDERFASFLRAFKNGLKSELVNGISFVEINKNKGTKDKTVIDAKLNILINLMCGFLKVSNDFLCIDKTLDFVKNNVNEDVNEEDIELYIKIFNDLTREFKDKRAVFNNKLALIAIIAYACEQDLDLDEWIKEHYKVKTFADQTENYIYMKKSLTDYLNTERVS